MKSSQLFLVICLCSRGCSALRITPGVLAHRPAAALASCPRVAVPRAALDGVASIVAAGGTTLVAADDFFGEVFMAGMSIAFAAVGATLFVGLVVRGNYDKIEKGFFDSQDAALNEPEPFAERKQAKSDAATSGFFGNTNAREIMPKSKPTETLAAAADFFGDAQQSDFVSDAEILGYGQPKEGSADDAE